MANIKFSQFTAEANIANFDDIVGYQGLVNKRITPANLASSLVTLSGGPYLPLVAGAANPLTGDLNLAATGAGPSVGSQAVVFNGVDDTSSAVIGAKLFTLDSTINPSGQDLVFEVADSAGTLQERIRIDAFGQVGIGVSAPNFTLFKFSLSIFIPRTKREENFSSSFLRVSTINSLPFINSG